MLGEPSNPFDVTIIGAGISGLSLAYYLQRFAPHLSLTLLEGSGRAGGVIATHREQGCLIDQGPDSFITAKPYARDLCKDLGLAQDLIAFGKNSKPLWMVKNGKLAALPEGLYLGLPKNHWQFLANGTLPLTMKLRMGLDFFHRKMHRAQDVSLGNFLRDHFGKQSIDWMFNPILGGIYASSVDALSTQATFPQFLALEKQYGSLIRGLRAQPIAPSGPSAGSPFLSLRNGMGQLIDTLQHTLAASSLQFNHQVSHLAFNPANQIYTVTVGAQNKTIQTRHLVLALPPSRAKEITANIPHASKWFDAFSASSTAVVFLGFEKKQIGNTLPGLGFLVPRKENFKTLAATFVSNKFEGRSPDDIFLLRTFFGGHNRENVLELHDSDLSQLALKEVQQILGFHSPPLFTKIFRYHQQSPLYGVGHLDQVAHFESNLKKQPRFHYLSNALYGVGIPDCIRKAKELAEQISKT